ncbi:MAG: hypothetical protein H7Z14_06145 [Anaerolineae bacterium]|nr:hypothetical protein [Phycisphaerae bacterium]
MTETGTSKTGTSNRKRRVGALVTLAICTACILTLGPASIVSSAPQEASSTTKTSGSPRFGPRERADRGRGAPHPQQSQPPTTQEREEVIEFFRTNMKNRMSVFDRLPDGQPAKNRMLQMMTERYRRLQRTKAQDPTVYELMVSQMVLQDEALSLLQDQRNSQNDATKREALEQELRDKVKQLINDTLQERRKRVEHLEQMLKDQKSRLELDEAHPDALVSQHLKQLKTDIDEMRKIWPGRRAGGMGMGERRPSPPTTDLTTEQGR